MANKSDDKHDLMVFAGFLHKDYNVSEECIIELLLHELNFSYPEMLRIMNSPEGCDVSEEFLVDTCLLLLGVDVKKFVFAMNEVCGFDASKIEAEICKFSSDDETELIDKVWKAQKAWDRKKRTAKT